MTPGRELDALIAEKVLGYKRLEDAPDGSERWRYPNEGKYSGIPSFSTSIEAAWEVVEKLRERGFAFHFTQLAEDGWGANAGFVDHADDRNIGVTRSLDSAPHAICLAALKAISR